MDDIDNLIATLAQDSRQVKSAPHPFALCVTWIAIAMLYLIVSLAVTGLRPDWADRLHQVPFAAEIAALFAVFASTTLASALLAFPDQHQKGRLLYASPLAFALFALTMYFSWVQDTPPAPLPVHSVECTLGITMMALLPSLWIFYLMRNYASTRGRLAGCNALLSSFCVGALWLRLHEVNDSVVHVIEWHYLPMLAIGAFGLWLGGRLLKW